MTEAKTQNYWISPSALRITLNALSDPDYMQASAASGAVIMCYMRGIDGLEFDAGHNYKRWKLSIAPTYYTTTSRKYVYVAIPRPTQSGEADNDVAQVVFPSEHIDIYGMNESEQQVGDAAYYYVWLQGIISASESGGVRNNRSWEQDIQWGTLSTDESTFAGDGDSWWSYSPITDMVTFLKKIAYAVFEYLKADQIEVHNLNITGTLDAIKGYIDDLRSHNYSQGLLDGAGFRLTNDNGEGSSELEVDMLKVRKKATFMELEIRKETFVGGNNHYSPAGSVLYRVEYLTETDGRLGYTVMKVPFLLKRFAFLGKMFNYAARKRIQRSLTDEEWKQCHHFRCYLLADDGTTATRNWWQVGDQARCQAFNKAVSSADKQSHTYNANGTVMDDPATPAPIETSYYWRLVSNTGSEKLDDGHVYDFVDMPYEGWSGYSEADKRSFRDGGSGIPVAGDTIVCMGNRTQEDRMNMISLYTSGRDNNPPAIKGYRGIHSFSLDNTLVFEMSPEQFLVRSRAFKLFDDSGYQFPVPLERGEWQQGVRYHWYDRVSWKGSIWLCQVLDTYVWQDASGNDYEQWRVEDIQMGEGDFDYYIDGSKAGTDHYYATGKVGGTAVYKVRFYTYSEPSRYNDLWLREVSKGTEIVSTEIHYAATLDGLNHPADDSDAWKETIAATGISMGKYLWTRTTINYDDPNDPNREPTREYSVSRWGIDGDGISEIDSYYLATSNASLVINASTDTYPKPGDSGWDNAGTQAKWYGTFGDAATANGGVGAMQGWNVWEKTVVKYDAYDDKGDSKTVPDMVNYRCSRIGQDGQIGQEEYYMLAESDDFNTVFGSAAPAYDKIGIRWYNQSDPAAENWRLSSTTPNINTSMWSAKMPTYNKDTHGKKVYLWNFEQRVDGMGTEYATRPVCIGNHARGIKGVIELYALSASQTPVSASILVPADINAKNTYGVIPTSGFEDVQVWGDEKYERAPSEQLPYQWNWTRTLYSAKDADGKDYEDHYHVSAVRGTKGEDGAGVEYVYCRPQSHNADGTAIAVTVPDPNVKKDAGGTERTADYIKAHDDFVPYQFTDNPVGIDFQHQVEYQAERKSSATTGTGGFTGGHEWGAFSTPKPWSKWGQNGMDGDGTEYVFIRTTTNVAPSIVNSADSRKDSKNRTYLDDEYLPLATGGSLTADTECTDDPAGTSREWPYEWVAKRTKAAPNAETGKRQWEKYSGTMALWSHYGENVVRMDIDNEMDMIQTDSQGIVQSERKITTTVHLLDGLKEVIMDPYYLDVKVNAPQGETLPPTKVNKIDGVTYPWVKLTWTFGVGFSKVSKPWDVTMSYTYNGVEYSAAFTIVPSLGQPICQLKPSHSSLPCTRKDDNTLNNPPALSLKVVKIDGSSTTEKDATSTNLTALGVVVRFKRSGMPTSATDGYAWPDTNSVQAETTDSNVYIAMFNSSGVLLDRETVPVIKDGANGQTAVRIDLDNENDSMLYDGSGTLVSGNVTATAYMFDGPTDVSSTTTFTISAREGVTAQQATISGRTVTVTGMTDAKAKVTVQGVYKDGQNKTHTLTAVLTLKKIVDGDKYDLVVSPNAIAYNITTDTPKETTVSIQVWKTSVNSSGGTTRALSAPPSGYNVYAGSTVLTASTAGKYSTKTTNKNIGELVVMIAKSATSDDILDLETIPIAKAENGKNVVRLDISNEMDMVRTTDALLIEEARTIETVVHIYDGTTEVDISSAAVSSSGGPASDIATYSAAASGKGRKLSWAFVKGKTMATAYEITISYTYNSVAYSAMFTIQASKGQPVLQLKPSHSSLPCTRKADNTLNNPPALSLKVVKIDGSSTTEKDATSANLTALGVVVRYSTTSMPASSTAGTAWPNGNSLQAATTDTNVYIAMFNSSGVLLDRETIPLVKDGEHGKSITKKSETYRYATNNTGTRPAATSSDWKTTKPTLNNGYWLYTETTITWSDNSTTVLYTDERNPNDGIAGQDIIVDGATVMKYYVGDSNTTHPAEGSSDWKDLSQVTQTPGKWLWSQAKTNYKKATDGTSAGSTYNYNVSYIAKDGQTGRAVKSITEYYKATNSSSAMSKPTSTSGWDSDPNLSHLTDKWDASHKYLWNMEKAVYTESNGTETTEYTIPQILAIFTVDGDPGRGIDSIVNKYKVTNTSTAPKREHEGGTGWDDNPTAPGQGEYLWNYEIISWTKGTTPTYTDVQMIGYAGTNGKNAVRIDLDNETDLVSVDADGKVRTAREVVVYAFIYEGGSSVVSGVTLGGGMNKTTLKIGDCEPNINQMGGGVGLTWNFTQGMAVTPTTKEIRLVYGNTTYTAVFTLGTTQSEAIWQVMPNPSRLSFTLNANNSLTPSQITAYCGYTRATGSGTESVEQATVDANGQITKTVGGSTVNTGMYLYYRKKETSGWDSWSKYPSSGGIDVLYNTSAQDYEFCITDGAMANDGSNIVDREMVPVVKDGKNGTAGQNALRLDIDNEMDSVPTDSTGVVLARTQVSTTVRFYNGASQAGMTVTNLNASVIRYSDNTNVAVSKYPTSGTRSECTFTWTFLQGMKIADIYEINIFYQHTQSVQYAAKFTIVASKGQATYQLKPTMSVVQFSRNTNGDIIGSPKEVGLTIVKTDSGTTTEYTTASAADVHVRYSFSSMPTTPADGSYTTWDGGTISVSSDNDNLYIAMFSSASGYPLLDRETIPVVREGRKGDKGDDSTVPGPQGKYEIKQYSISEYKTSTNAQTSPADCSENDWTNDAPLPTTRKPFLWQRTRTYNPATNSYGSWQYVRLTGEDGSQGSPGKVGLWYRYLGVWRVDCGPGTSTPVTNTSTVGYYVKYGNDFYMNTLSAGTPNTDTPGSTGWELMTSVFQYFITQAIFGDYAHFGSFIINGQWMISQQGMLGSSASSAYEKFDPTYPDRSVNGNHTAPNTDTWYGYNFVPNFAVDGKTGAVYMQNAHIKGNITAAAGYIGGLSIQSDGLMYNNGSIISSFTPSGIWLNNNKLTVGSSSTVDDGVELKCRIVKGVNVYNTAHTATNEEPVILMNISSDTTLYLPADPVYGQEIWIRSIDKYRKLKVNGNSKTIQDVDHKDGVDSFIIDGDNSQKWYHGIYAGNWYF